MARMTKINDHFFQFGSNVRLERGLATHRDKAPDWVVSRKTNVRDDPDTTDEERWVDVANFTEEEAGEAPAAAMKRAETEAAKGE